jgi:hypothetical protein
MTRFMIAMSVGASALALSLGLGLLSQTQTASATTQPDSGPGAPELPVAPDDAQPMCAPLERACGAGQNPAMCCGGDAVQCFRGWCKRKGVANAQCGNQHPMCATGLRCAGGRCVPI